MILEDIKGIGESKLKLLNDHNIYSIEDLVSYFPFRYEEIKRSDINSLNDGDKIIIDGVVETIPNLFYFNRKMDKMSFKLNTGDNIYLVTIFNRGFLKSKLPIGTSVTIIGKLDKKRNSIVCSDLKFGLLNINEKIEPIYHTLGGISGTQINKYILDVIAESNVIDYIPNYLITKYNFMDKNRSIKIAHKPTDLKLLKLALNRLKYEELFLFMLKMNYLKNNKVNKIGLKRSVPYEKIESFINELPFSLTIDQLNSVKDIYNDLIEPKRMNRLLQGDVGSGKTIISFISMYINYLSGYQSALMAPTEILAKQHFENIKKTFKNYDINISLITGKTKAADKKKIHEDLSNGKIDIIIGTHALITSNINYNNLGLVITDEQHRFGVNQRGILKNKGLTPDILYMSATPIPRTYALTLYGDMDISNIKTMPNGRKQIVTSLKKNSEMKDVLESMYEEIKNNHQIYVVAPLIEESEKIDLENTNELYNKMNKAFGKLCSIGIIHGKMTNNDKEEVMNKFRNNDIQILISTTVIEVGVDVPNATMIVIFDADRFGLSALHQLRGRVGRNELESKCILISDHDKERLDVLVNTSDGFKICEEDFRLRGSGDLFGIKQSGDMNFRLADFKKDFNILMKAKEDSNEFLNSELLINSNQNIKNILDTMGNLD